MSTADCEDRFELFPVFFSVKVRRASTTRRRERPDHHDPRYLRIKVSREKTSVQANET